MTINTLNPLYPSKESTVANWGQLHGCAQDLLIANTTKEYKGLIVVVTPDSQSAYNIKDNVNFFLGNTAKNINQKEVHIFPDWETLPYDVFSPHEDLISDRLKTLSQLHTIKQGVLIVPVATLMQRLPPVDYVRANTLLIKQGDTLDIEIFRSQLEESGYRNVTQVMEHGEYSTRGSLIDLFPMGNDKPYRIDLFDDEIESIRNFNPDDQRTIEKIDRIDLLPAHEFPLNKPGIEKFRENYSTRIGGDLARSQIYDNISNGNAPSGIEYYLPLFFDSTATLFDYFPEKTLVINTDSTKASAETFSKLIEDRYEQRSHDIERPLLEPSELFLSTKELFASLENYRRIDAHHFEQQKGSDESENLHNYPVHILPSLMIQGRSETPLVLFEQFLMQFNNELSNKAKGRFH